MKKRNLLALTAAFALSLMACGQAAQRAANEPGIIDTQIVLGGTHPLHGGASFYGVIGKAAEAYFNYVNDQGGINGRKIVYKNLDDGYTATNTVQLTKQLVEQDQVFAMFNGLGTPPQTAVQPYLNQKKVPQLFVATGASKWGLDYKNYPWTIGWQPNYISESIIYAKDLLKNNPDPKIAVLYQNDDYGEDYLNGLTKGLGSKANLIIAKQTYESTAADVRSEVAKLKFSGANTFFIFATPKYSGQALGFAKALGWKPTIYLNNVSAPQSFMKATTQAAGADATNGVISTAYLKDPADPKWENDPGVKLYKQIMAKYYPSGDPNDGFNFYGMGASYTMVDVLKKAGKNLTRAGVLDVVTNLNETDNPFALPGVVIKTTPNDRFPITQSQLERFDNGKWVLFGDLIDSRGQLG